MQYIKKKKKKKKKKKTHLKLHTCKTWLLYTHVQNCYKFEHEKTIKKTYKYKCAGVGA